MSHAVASLSAERRHEIRDAFDLFDTEGKERLEAADLPIALRALGFSLPDDEVATLLKMADRKDTGMATPRAVPTR